MWRSTRSCARSTTRTKPAPERDAERIVGSWFRFYGESRPHSSLGGRTPGGSLPGRFGGGRVSRPGTMCAGNATSLAAANWLATTGRVLPVVANRLSHTTAADASTMPLTSSGSVGRFRSSRVPNQSEYTLVPPSDCPTNQDHLRNRECGARNSVYSFLGNELVTIV